LDREVGDTQVLFLPVELCVELTPIISLNGLHPKRQVRQHIIHKVHEVLLVVGLIDLEHSQAGAVINGGELIVALAIAWNRVQELHMYL
jgi:hypothetical protein